MITADIKLGTDYHTRVSGKTIEEILEKIKGYHILSDPEREHFTKKGTLADELASGWYIEK